MDELSGDVRKLWNSNRPLALTLLVGLGVLLWWLSRRRQGGLLVPPNVTASATGVSSGFTPDLGDNAPLLASPSPITPQPGQLVSNWGYQPVPDMTPPTLLHPVAGKNRITPIIPYNALPPGTRYSTAADLRKEPTLLWMGVTYKKFPDPRRPGFLWGQPVKGGEQVLLYGPPSAY